MSRHLNLGVGGLSVPFDEASAWATDYLDATENRSSDKPYAYPAYDGYNAEQDLADQITDADLLAPALLNVTVSIRAFYGLQAVRDTLQQALPPAPTPALQDASADLVVGLVKPIYAVLDDPGVEGVRCTTVSKIVHRKRPNFLVLHDNWVWTCYQKVAGAPVPAVKGRSRADYMAAISLAIRDDIRTHYDTWTALHDATNRTDGAPVSLVRLLDIIAWHAGQQPSRLLASGS